VNMEVNQEQIEKVGRLLNSKERPLKERFRALFTLKNIGGEASIDWISKAFSDDSALLKHEVAYCLGQLQDPYAIPVLTSVLADTTREPIVRHEAGEALAAIGGEEVEATLKKYTENDVVEVMETCQLALDMIQFRKNGKKVDCNEFGSVDPAPASEENSLENLKLALMDSKLSLFDRYKAMFALRNRGDEESIKALASGLTDSSALFRHEIAFVLGQVASPHAVNELVSRLRDKEESAMVRHECAEALGSIATPGLDVEAELSRYLSQDTPSVVRESCVIALDMADYNNSHEFQYANGLDE